MDREEILEKSREENRGGDEREAQITAKAWQIGATVGIIVCGLIMIVFGIASDGGMEYIADNLMIYFAMIATTYTVKAAKLKAKGDIVSAVLFWVCFAFWTALFAANMVK